MNAQSANSPSSLPLTKSALADFDLKAASSALKSALASVDSAAQKIGPRVGMLRYQVKLKDGDLSKIADSFPKDSLASSTLRNCKVYEDVFREYVLKGLLTEDKYHALTFKDCRDLIETARLVTASARDKKTCAVEAQREALTAGLAPAEVLAAVKKSDKKTVTALKKSDKEREEKRAENAAAAAAEREAFKAFKASPPDSAPPPAPTPDNAGSMTELFMTMISSLKPRQRALMPDMLRAMADRIEADSTPDSAPAPTNIVEMKQAA